MPKPLVVGLSGLALTPDEVEFLREIQPAGLLLFARNIHSFEQVRALVDSIKKLYPSDFPPLLGVDQEGGRVQRLCFHGRYPAVGFWGRLFVVDEEMALKGAFLQGVLLASDLRDIGANWVLGPVLDRYVVGAHSIIGDRAFSADAHIVTQLAGKMLEGIGNGGCFSCLKHAPGHGLAQVDSHAELPIVRESLDCLRSTDFVPFANLARQSDFMMTAHICYPDLDPLRPATFSLPILQNLCRDEWGFSGAIVSDDVGMEALDGDYMGRVHRSLEAGCDLVITALSSLRYGMAGTVFDNQHFDELKRGAHLLPDVSPFVLSLMKKDISLFSSEKIAYMRSDFEHLYADAQYLLG